MERCQQIMDYDASTAPPTIIRCGRAEEHEYHWPQHGSMRAHPYSPWPPPTEDGPSKYEVT